jgi:WD40 repeat protein
VQGTLVANRRARFTYPKDEEMKTLALLFVAGLAGGLRSADAQGAPDVVWEAATPGLLANSVIAVGWSPVDDNLAVGSNDRWFRLRRARDGALQYSVLEPQHSSGPGNILYSTDGTMIGVRNQSSGLSFRVQQTSNGALLGNVVATVASNGLVSFAPDATLLANTGPGGTISQWHFSELTVFQTTGSGYQQVTTAFNFSPDGLLQTAARKGQITVQRRADGAILRILRGGSKVVFSPDSSLLAAWSAFTPNEIVLWRTSDWMIEHKLTSANTHEGVSGLRFTPDGTRLVSTGYSAYQDQYGLWQQKGLIRFWDLASGTVVWMFDQQTDIGVTSPVAWSPDGSLFTYGLYNGTVAVAHTPL